MLRWGAAVLAGLLLGVSAHAGTLAAVSVTLAPGTLLDTYYIFPDHQGIVRTQLEGTSPWGGLTSGNTDAEQKAQWICTNRDARNIKGALGVGDLVLTGSVQAQWDILNDMVTILDGCRVPYIPTYGNHDGGPTVQRPSQTGGQDATLYHTNQGQDVMDAKGWFAGSRAERPDWIETNTAGTSLYGENTTTYASRSFWVPLPPFNIAVPEWEYGVRISRGTPLAGVDDGAWGGEPSNAVPWLRTLRDTYSHDYWFHITHAGPCDTPQNCDLTPEDIGIGGGTGRMGGDWSSELDSLGPNFVAFMNGHWGRASARACWGGIGTYANAVRDDGTRWMAGGFDNNCGARLDTFTDGTNTNFCPADGLSSGPTGCPDPADCIDCDLNPYTWSAWIYLDRTSRQLCFDTIRTIDVDADDDGTPNTTARPGDGDQADLIALGSIDTDFGSTFGAPVLTPQNDKCQAGNVDSGPADGCPNQDTPYCITIADLP